MLRGRRLDEGCLMEGSSGFALDVTCGARRPNS
jgi:hypothetical protein